MIPVSARSRIPRSPIPHFHVPRALAAPSLGAAALGLMLGLPATAQGQMIVVGQPRAASCYHNALYERVSDSALAECTSALGQDVLSTRDRGATHVNRAIVHIHRGEYEAALADVEMSTRYRDFAQAYATRGVVYFHLGRIEDSVEQATIALARTDLRERAKIYYNRAVALELLERIEDAYYDYQRAAEADPRWDLPRQELQRFTVVRGGAPAS